MNIAIVEDDEETRADLSSYIERYAKEQDFPCVVYPYATASRLLQSFRMDLDIILLDIEMPGMDGMTAAGKIREMDTNVVLMFVTNMSRYAIHGYAVGALDFVLKPLTYESFRNHFRRAVLRADQRKKEEILIRLEGGARKLDVRSIHYIDVEGHMLHYHTSEGEFSARGSLKSVREELAKYHFAKCSQWYLVNLRSVEKIGRDTVTVAGKDLEMSRRAKAEFLDALTRYMSQA